MYAFVLVIVIAICHSCILPCLETVGKHLEFVCSFCYNSILLYLLYFQIYVPFIFYIFSFYGVPRTNDLAIFISLWIYC